MNLENCSIERLYQLQETARTFGQFNASSHIQEIIYQKESEILCEKGHHKWTKWCSPYKSGKRYYQTKECERCGIVKARRVWRYRECAQNK